MNALTAALHYTHKLPRSLIQRAQALYMPKPEDCTAVMLIPTLVHDRGSGDALAVAPMDNVVAQIEALGWPKASIEPWSIAISKLIACLICLNNQEVFPT
jgi:hypothetical protein